MKTRSTSRPAAGEERRSAANAQTGAQLRQAAAATMPDARASSLAQLQHQERASNSSQAAQLKAHADMMAGRSADAPVQRAEDEELLQGKFSVAQRAEDEELLQGKFATVQRVEDEELLQGKFAPVQRMDEEEPLQGKFDALQGKEAGTSLQGRFEQTPASVGRLKASVRREAKSNDTGLPNQLKAGIESLSGMSMDHVKVHYNSDKPAQLQAHAYAQGSEIHVAPGQERHLPHEAWHVVQQAQGRVRPTLQMKGGQRGVAGKTVQLQRLTRVVGGMQVDLDDISDANLLATYKNYYMPSRDQQNYAQFGIDIREELLNRGQPVPTLDSETVLVKTKGGNAKYGLLLDYYYRPLTGHEPAGNTHYPGYDGIPNTRAHHVMLTEAGVKLMFAALQLINDSKAQFLETDESFTNVYVKVNGVKWGLHLGEARQIFPIEGQAMPEYFDS